MEHSTAVRRHPQNTAPDPFKNSVTVAVKNKIKDEVAAEPSPADGVNAPARPRKNLNVAGVDHHMRIAAAEPSERSFEIGANSVVATKRQQSEHIRLGAVRENPDPSTSG